MKRNLSKSHRKGSNLKKITVHGYVRKDGTRVHAYKRCIHC